MRVHNLKYMLLASTLLLAGCGQTAKRSVSPAVIAACGEEVYIPMQGAAESLNAAVAAALCMWELSGRGSLPE